MKLLASYSDYSSSSLPSQGSGCGGEMLFLCPITVLNSSSFSLCHASCLVPLSFSSLFCYIIFLFPCEPFLFLISFSVASFSCS
uniref:Uncharacterized protein n=1 Tax=Nelumbo nucifera TaxID=4432 RepID=A0A822ZNB1_NELNU|nr:TPA_asm: hypothetical protein HUJ06_001498 [Nelumbo nucifera]